MRTRSAVLAMSCLALPAGSAFALQPCPESCRLGQGQPIYLADADAEAVLMTRCDRTKGKTGASYTCVTERLALDGQVLNQLPRPRRTGPDADFTKTQLAGHKLFQLSWQAPFKPLNKPYTLSELFGHQLLTLTLEKSTLHCAAPGLPTVSRDFGCVPSEVHVFATMGIDKPPRRPVIVVGVCQTDANTAREVVVACTAAESKK